MMPREGTIYPRTHTAQFLPSASKMGHLAKYENVVRGGVRLIVMVMPDPMRKGRGFRRPAMGFFDAVASEQNFGDGEYSYVVDYITDRACGIFFEEYDDRETYVAMAPDDRFFHNRMIFATDQNYYKWIVEQQVDYNVSISGDETRMEIDTLKEVIMENKPIFKVMRPGGMGEVGFFWKRKEAQDFIDLEEDELFNRGLSTRKVQRYKGCEIVEGVKLDLKPKYRDMYNKYKAAPYGWTNPDVNSEFRETTELIERLCDDKRAGSTVHNAMVPSAEIDARAASIAEQTVSKILNSLGLDKDALLNTPGIAPEPVSETPQTGEEAMAAMLGEGGGDNRDEETKQKLADEEAALKAKKEAESKAKQNPLTYQDMMKMSKDDLRALAKENGIDTSVLNKQQTASALIKEFKRQAEDAEPVIT